MDEPTLTPDTFDVPALEPDVTSAHLRFWHEYLAGNPSPFQLSTDRPRQAAARTIGAVQKFAFSSRLRDGLMDLAGRERVSLDATLLAVFGVLLFRYGRGWRSLPAPASPWCSRSR